jgi:hypothetical protein
MTSTPDRGYSRPMPKFKFPDHRDRSQNEPSALCPAERVLFLYNQDSGNKVTTRISKTVRSWFEDAARQQGWADVRWFRDVSTNSGAGCVLSIGSFAFGVTAAADEEEDDPDAEQEDDE